MAISAGYHVFVSSDVCDLVNVVTLMMVVNVRPYVKLSRLGIS